MGEARSGGRGAKAPPPTRLQQYESYDRRLGERAGLFAAVAEVVAVGCALYPGSYIDIGPSLVWADVTYVDNDRQAKRFFASAGEVEHLIAAKQRYGGAATIAYLGADYRGALPLADGSFDLLISLYAGFVSEPCTRYLRPGGWLLANDSHGDASLAALDPRYRLVAVIDQRVDGYTVTTGGLDAYLVPRRGIEVTAELLHRTGRGVAYTMAPSAYLFQRLGRIGD